jgi:cytidyltransferase-like protein
MSNSIPKTLFIDIDGTILTHPGKLYNIFKNEQAVLPNVHDAFDKWKFDGHQIILTTARPESMRTFTTQQLQRLGVVYDQLIMGLEHGERILINDSKPNSKNKSVTSIEVERDTGLTKNVINSSIKEYDIGVCSGFFAPLHLGHIDYFRLTKQICNQLLVIVNNDKQTLLKNKTIFLDQITRCQIIDELRCVNGVILSIDNDISVAKTLEKIANDNKTKTIAFFNSGDRDQAYWNNQENIICTKYKIPQIFLNTPKINSSSKILKDYLNANGH